MKREREERGTEGKKDVVCYHRYTIEWALGRGDMVNKRNKEREC